MALSASRLIVRITPISAFFVSALSLLFAKKFLFDYGFSFDTDFAIAGKILVKKHVT